ncbi:tail fiber domain-containing protein, partial [Bacillus cereus]|nr:tail fiber domain-containing protein [Bacillus cereus]
LTFLKKIASLFKLEIQYRVEIQGSQIIGWYVDMIQRRGRDTGKEIELGKDLIGVTRIEHSRDICTALVGFVKGEGDNVITIESINRGLPYIVDNDAFQRWNERGKHKFGFYTPETEELDMTSKRLMTLMEIELKKRVNSSVSYEVEAQSIGRIFGLAHELINEGDTIRIKDTGFTPKLYLEARVIAGDESFTDPTQDKYVFGDYREMTDPNEELRKIYNRILGSLGNKQELIDQLDKLVKDANEAASNAKKESEAAKTLAEKVQENLKNNTVDIIEAKNPPTTGLKPYKTLWRDISNGKPGILKIWTGAAWESVVPDVESVKKETLEQVNKDIESAKTELNQKVQSVEGKAQEIAGQIVDVEKQVNGKVDQTWINTQLKDKADKSGVFTKEEINNGFIGKQIYETDKNGNVKKFQDINTSMSQTNEVLKQKAEKSELTKTNEGLSQLEQKTNEVIQTADGTKQTLKELKTQVDNTKIGGRNVVLGTSIPANVIGNNTANQTVNIYNFAGGDSNSILNKEICVSFDWKVEGTTTPTGTMYMQGSNPYPLIASKITFSPQNLSGKYLSVITISGSAFKAVNMRLDNFTTGAKITITNFQIETGNTATAWQPAPEDQVTTTDFTNKTVEFETTIKGINVSVSNVQNEQGKLAERVTKSEQTADGFKTSIESLTKKDNDISNKLNIVEQTVEGTKKTISEVEQTTNDLKKTTTEVKEQAGKISEKLTTVETKVNSDKAGGRNLLLDSNAKYEKTDYLINVFSLTENFVAGEDYTFVIKGSVPAGQKFGIWMNGGSSNVGYATSVYANGITYVTFKAVVATSGNERKLSLYNFPSNTTKSVVEWVALYKGNKPQDWTPAPENQVTNDEFTKKTTEIEKSVDGVTNTVSKVRNSQDGFEKRMTTVEQTATGLSSTVGNLNNVVSDQGKKLTDANTKIEQQATAIGAKVELKQVENYVAGFKIPELKQTVDKNKQDLLGELANKLATEQFNQQMTLIDNRFTINEKGIDAGVKRTEVYTREQANGQFATSSYVRDMETRLQLTEKGVSISVKENDVIAAFNMSKENITLNANRINLRGFITADHIKGQVLEGVTLKTTGSRFVEINKQDFKIFDANKARGYMGFMEATDGSIQPSLVLGSDNIKYRGTGSFYIYQTMPRINGVDQPTKAWAKLGISKGETAEGDNIWSSYIQMLNDGGHMDMYAAGKLRFKCLNNIEIEAEGWTSGAGSFSVTTTEPHSFNNNWGQFTFRRKNSPNEIHIMNGANDHDLIMGRVTIRSSLVSGYNNGLQIKDSQGSGWRDIQLRTLYAEEDAIATQNMWAKAFKTTSARNMKENIKDIPFSALDKIMSLAIKQYNFKDDMYDLYQMRVNKPEEKTEPYTTKEIETYFGMIADDTDDIFTDKEKRAINLYNTVSIFIAAFQQQYHEFNEELTTVKSENKQLKEQVATLTNDVSTLKELVQKLINGKPEQP